jgi:hypothetical protein
MHKNHYLKQKDTEIGAEKHNTFLTVVVVVVVVVIIIIDGLTVRYGNLMIPLYASPMKLKANKIVAKKGESKLNPRGFYTHRQSKKCVVVGVCVECYAE